MRIRQFLSFSASKFIREMRIFLGKQISNVKMSSVSLPFLLGITSNFLWGSIPFQESVLEVWLGLHPDQSQYWNLLGLFRDRHMTKWSQWNLLSPSWGWQYKMILSFPLALTGYNLWSCWHPLAIPQIQRVQSVQRAQSTELKDGTEEQALMPLSDLL